MHDSFVVLIVFPTYLQFHFSDGFVGLQRKPADCNLLLKTDFHQKYLQMRKLKIVTTLHITLIYGILEFKSVTGFTAGKEKFCFPLDSSINKHIFLTVLHMFLILLVRRICLNIKSFFLVDQSIRSHDLLV